MMFDVNQIINSKLYGDSFEFLHQFPDKSVDMILTDPPYDFSNEQKETLQKEFMRISRGWIIVFSPPENQWVQPASQYLFWIKPISTKNTSKKYSRFVEMIFVMVLAHGTMSDIGHNIQTCSLTS